MAKIDTVVHKLCGENMVNSISKNKKIKNFAPNVENLFKMLDNAGGGCIFMKNCRNKSDSVSQTTFAQKTRCEMLTKWRDKN